MKYIGLHIIRFLALVFAQTMIIDNLDLGPNVYPMVYILFILLLPAELPAWGLMLLAFILGLSIDTFNSTLGLHISACVFLAFTRPLILRVLSPRDGYEAGQDFGINSMGIRWMLNYTALMTLCHHLWFFYMEVFAFENMGTTFLRVIQSTLTSLIGIILILYLFRRNSRSI